MIALQILVWFLPWSFVNSVTQYVLIAVNQQRFLTLAFVIGVAFNVAANLILIPPFGYVAAAAVTVASEIVLLIPFYYAVRKHLGAGSLGGAALAAHGSGRGHGRGGLVGRRRSSRRWWRRPSAGSSTWPCCWPCGPLARRTGRWCESCWGASAPAGHDP